MNGSLNPFRFFRLCRDLQDVYLVCSSKLKICSTSAWSRGNQERGAAFQAIDNLGPVAWLGLLSRFSAGFHPSLDQIKKVRQSLRAAELNWSFLSWVTGVFIQQCPPSVHGLKKTLCWGQLPFKIIMVSLWVWQRKRPPRGDRGLSDSPRL